MFWIKMLKTKYSKIFFYNFQAIFIHIFFWFLSSFMFAHLVTSNEPLNVLRFPNNKISGKKIRVKRLLRHWTNPLLPPSRFIHPSNKIDRRAVKSSCWSDLLLVFTRWGWEKNGENNCQKNILKVLVIIFLDFCHCNKNWVRKISIILSTRKERKRAEIHTSGSKAIVHMLKLKTINHEYEMLTMDVRYINFSSTLSMKLKCMNVCRSRCMKSVFHKCFV
jgi:hypothetical protein